MASRNRKRTPEQKQIEKEYKQKQRDDWKARGLCHSCGNGPAVKDKQSCDKCLERGMAYRACQRVTREAAGLCNICGKLPRKVGATMCEPCALKACERQKKYTTLDARLAYHHKGVCVECKSRPVLPEQMRCDFCKDASNARTRANRRDPDKYDAILEKERAYVDANREATRVRAKDYGRRRKLRVLEAYGNVCACCGESEPSFLSIDHINGDGAAHRKAVGLEGRGSGGKKHFYSWLINNNFPDTFQILCFNCNCSKGTGMLCYHQRLKVPHPDQLTLFGDDEHIT